MSREQEIKKELVADTAFVGSLLFACAAAILPLSSALRWNHTASKRGDVVVA